jgi:hypothetical protein
MIARLNSIGIWLFSQLVAFQPRPLEGRISSGWAFSIHLANAVVRVFALFQAESGEDGWFATLRRLHDEFL